jgi:hypothetical protein
MVMQIRDCGKKRGAWFLEVGIGRGTRKGDGAGRVRAQAVAAWSTGINTLNICKAGRGRGLTDSARTSGGTGSCLHVSEKKKKSKRRILGCADDRRWRDEGLGGAQGGAKLGPQTGADSGTSIPLNKPGLDFRLLHSTYFFTKYTLRDLLQACQ